jgi:hypothetical protein
VTVAADYRALLGVDVIESASTAPHLLPQVPTVLETLLAGGMHAAGVPREDAVDAQYTGDGWLYAFPTALLGQAVDLGPALAPIVAEHNRWNKLELRLRLAVDVGPLPDGRGFHPANIARARLLEAPAFKALARRCMAERPDGSMSTAIIVSDAVYQDVFRHDWARHARPTDFAELAVTNKEFTARAWVAVPGFDARTLADFIAEDLPQASAPVEETDATRPGPVTSVMNVGTNHGVQAHTINGGVVQNHRRR